MNKKILQVGIIGATGYTGIELLRLLLRHEQVAIHVITSDVYSGKCVAEVFPSLLGHIDMRFSAHDTTALHQCDVVFFASPHATAMYKAPHLLDLGIKIIDLSADFRLQDIKQWEHWYHVEHAAPELLKIAVYGLPEINRKQIAKANIVANPGCYATAIILGFLPLIESNCVDLHSLIADAKSGVSGAGRKASVASLFGEVSENFNAYGLSGHRHLPEICQTLNACCGQTIDLLFVPHLTPMIRGIFATLYARLNQINGPVEDSYKLRYANEPFVEVVSKDCQLDTASVRGTNMCRIMINQRVDSDKLVVLSVIDNLVKGAAGQAIQNMNIMFDLPEVTGLGLSAIYP